MSDDQTAFVEGRVRSTRRVLHFDYPADSADPSLALMVESTDGGAALVLMPTAVPGLLHVEMHGFVDGQRTAPTMTVNPDGSAELMLRRSDQTE